MVLGIVAASSSEAKTLLGSEPVVGKVYSLGPDALLAVAGVGEFSARVAADALLEKGASALLSWGVAAGLQPGLQAGDVLLPAAICSGRRKYPVNSDWHQAVKARLNGVIDISEGLLAHTDCLLNLPADKEALHSSSKAAAVDRESASVAKVAKKANVPFLALKTIADPANLRVPQVLGAQNDDGLKQRKLLSTLGPRPWLWLNMIKLSRCSLLALGRLHKIAKKLEFDFLPPAGEAQEQTA